jgi:hypothetical protein
MAAAFEMRIADGVVDVSWLGAERFRDVASLVSLNRHIQEE